MPTLISSLRALRKLLGKEERWTKCVGARAADGTPCDPCAPEAASWCLSGATDKLRDDDWKLFEALRGALPGRHTCVTIWQDAQRRRHSEVLALIDRAIANERKKKDVR